MAGFEKSGHFFFNKPLGRGYNDGLIFALAVCDMLDRNPDKSMADLKNALPKTWSSPTCRRTAPTRSSIAWSTTW
jgi:phosphomannomutase/phosphoglucomutase